MRAVIIDDEEDVHKVITRILDQKCPDVRVVGNAASVNGGLEMLKEVKPDLVFLDIKMPGGTGFDILEKCNDLSFKLIFITAFDEFAIRAFKFSAVDYILKPINSGELISAVERIHERVGQREKVQSMMDNLGSENRMKKITIVSVGKVQFVDLADIMEITSDGSYSNIHLTDGQVIFATKPIKEFEELLSDEGFFRVHRSHLINLSEVAEYRKKDSGDQIIFKNNAVIEVYRKKRSEFLDAMARFNEN